MDNHDEHDHLLIREAAILVRVPKGRRDVDDTTDVAYFDVRTGVPLREIFPALQPKELARAFPLSEDNASAILRTGASSRIDPATDQAKVVDIGEARQRKLDSIVADSIIDQARIIHELLGVFLNVADTAQREERFWLSQQILSLVRKFSGRELTELEEMIAWFGKRPPRA